MSAQFSLRISDLRREKNISQKQAAENLGVSQALLSHYEKGIRECSLNFVSRAAEYYDVTSDYLLGLSDTRQGVAEIFDNHSIPSDSQMRVRTLFRSVLRLCDTVSGEGGTGEGTFIDYFALSIYRFVALTFEGAPAQIDRAAAINLSGMLLSRIKDSFHSCAAQGKAELPECVNTVINYSEEIIRRETAQMLAGK